MRRGTSFWKRAPFVRLLIPFCTGIALQWYRDPHPLWWWTLLVSGVLTAVILSFLPLFRKFQLRRITGAFALLPFIAIGGLMAWKNDIRHSPGWIGKLRSPGAVWRVSLLEAPIEKERSFKAIAAVHALHHDHKWVTAKGKLIIYFPKDSLPPGLKYGSRLLFRKDPEEIRNLGNPGGFDYKRFALFQQLTHQVYLPAGQLHVLNGHDRVWLPAILEKIRNEVLAIIRTNIKGEKESGLAEALLIGYKNDLDKELVQSYANTGVVHVIAISGLHLGLIYWLLAGLLYPLQKRKYGRWLRPLLIMAGLWTFALLTGAQPSIMRSAVMFTCIVLGENMERKSLIFNTLACSAFILLCHNPFWLWDIGFQLSYSAVLSIVIYMRPVYHLLYFKNRACDLVWKMNAVTLSAQLLTLPLSIYHFHQFPTLFLFTNLVAVPLSSIILLAEILLCTLFFFTSGAQMLGKMTGMLIRLMNDYIERIDAISFSLWEGLEINFPQLLTMLAFIFATHFWLLEKKARLLLTAIAAISLFMAMRCISFRQAGSQQKLIVYNIPRQSAMDLISGRWHLFKGDSGLLTGSPGNDFYLKPARTLFRLRPAHSLRVSQGLFVIAGKKVLVADQPLYFEIKSTRDSLDLLVITKNARLPLPRLAKVFNIGRVVFDSSVTGWKLASWKKDCDSLQLLYHDVSKDGAFVMNLN